MCLLLKAHTSSGCVLAGTGLATPKKPKRSHSNNHNNPHIPNHRENNNHTPKLGGEVNYAKVVQEASSVLFADLQSGACVDRYLQDQLIILMALAEGVSQFLNDQKPP